jgi:hypothetical protein
MKYYTGRGLIALKDVLQTGISSFELNRSTHQEVFINLRFEYKLHHSYSDEDSESTQQDEFEIYSQTYIDWARYLIHRDGTGRVVQ